MQEEEDSGGLSIEVKVSIKGWVREAVADPERDARSELKRLWD
jgi:hypothetical protein